MVRAIVFDIEGTICPISFVKDILYPYSINKIHELLKDVQFPVSSSPSKGELINYLAQFPSETVIDQRTLVNHIDDLVKNDIKAPYWKSLQGYLWRFGYLQGEITAPLFPDVPTKFQTWADAYNLYIYSSGSVAAQKLLLSHTSVMDEPADLTGYVTDYFDTVNVGSKVETKSYELIADKISIDPSDILFLSDNHLEIKAARDAGVHTALTVRPGNPELPSDWVNDSSIITTLDDLKEF